MANPRTNAYTYRRCAALALVCAGSCDSASRKWEAALQLLEKQVPNQAAGTPAACLGRHMSVPAIFLVMNHR